MGKKAPKSDPAIAQAAMLSAQTGQDYLAFMKGQAEISNKWAADDRSRYLTKFQPLEDKFVADAQTWDSPEKQDEASRLAMADTSLALSQAQGQQKRQAMAMGVNPASGRFADAATKTATGGALATAGAGNLARRQIKMTGDAMRAEAINLGKGMAVNPGTSLSMANGAAGQGFGGAMSGYGQQANILNQDYQNKLKAHESNQSMLGGIGSALGSVAGSLPWAAMLSSKKAKTNKKPARNLIDAVKKLKVESWDYKKGMGDEGHHVGPYAEDFKKATGLGDGKTINVIDAIGVTMGAVKDLATKVDRIGRQIRMAA